MSFYLWKFGLNLFFFESILNRYDLAAKRLFDPSQEYAIFRTLFILLP